MSEATTELRAKKVDFQARNSEATDIRNRVDRLRNEVEHKEHQEMVMNDKIVEFGHSLAQNNDIKHQFKSSCDEIKREISNYRNSSLVCERDLIRMEEKIARAEQDKVNRENVLVSLDAELKLGEAARDDLLNKRQELNNNIGRQQSEINRSSSRLMEVDSAVTYLKQEMVKMKVSIQTTERKRDDETEAREELNVKINHAQLELKKLDDMVSTEEKTTGVLGEELQVYNERKVDLTRENRELSDLLRKLQCQNSSLIANLEGMERENEEVMYMLKRDEDYKELKVTIGGSISTAQEIIYKKKTYS